jgi:hypothetical protein
MILCLDRSTLTLHRLALANADAENESGRPWTRVYQAATQTGAELGSVTDLDSRGRRPCAPGSHEGSSIDALPSAPDA